MRKTVDLFRHTSPGKKELEKSKPEETNLAAINYISGTTGLKLSVECLPAGNRFGNFLHGGTTNSTKIACSNGSNNPKIEFAIPLIIDKIYRKKVLTGNSEETAHA